MRARDKGGRGALQDAETMICCEDVMNRVGLNRRRMNANENEGIS